MIDNGQEITIKGESKMISDASITVTYGLSLQVVEDYNYIGW